MKKFNLKEYLANPDKEVITRDGNPVRIICTDREARDNQPVVALVKESDIGEVCCMFKTDGSFYGVCGESHFDLFFKTTKREGWINVLDHHTGTLCCSCVFADEESALRVRDRSTTDCVATVKIEWEE